MMPGVERTWNRRRGGSARWLGALFVELFAVAACLLLASAPAGAQTLQGQWVTEADQRIARHRMAPIRIIVLDADGKPAPGAAVHIEQLRHDFPIGFAIGETELDQVPWDQPVWRCFNAVALDRLTAWPALQPMPGQWNFERVERAVEAATRRGLSPRWGGVISADLGRVPAWAGAMRGEALAAAADAHLAAVLDAFGRRVDQFDLYTHSLTHDALNQAAVRRLFEQGKARSPASVMCVRFEDTLTQVQAREMIARIARMRQAMIPVDAISIEHRIGGILLQAPLARVFELVGDLGVDVVLGSVEIGGASEAAAALNLETFLRTAFADPGVTGVYFAGVGGGDLVNAHAALIDEFGGATEPGRMLDNLFHGLWWTDARYVADDLGNVRARVFAGSHRITATLADGRRVTMQVHVAAPPADDEPRVILLEPIR